MGGISAALACRSTPLRPVPVVGPSILSGCRVHSGWHRGWRSTLRRPPCHPRVLVGCLRPVCYFGPATDAGATQTACCLWRRRGSAPVTLPAALRRGIRQRAHALPDCCALPVRPFLAFIPARAGWLAGICWLCLSSQPLSWVRGEVRRRSHSPLFLPRTDTRAFGEPAPPRAGRSPAARSRVDGGHVPAAPHPAVSTWLFAGLASWL